MKKILSVVLAVIMIMSMACVAFAAPNYKITASANKTSVEKGEVVTVTVAIPSNSNLCVLSYKVAFDVNCFTYVEDSFTLGGAFSMEMENTDTANTDGTIKYAGISSSYVTKAATLLSFQVIAENSGKIEFSILEAYIGEDAIDKLDAFQANSTKEIYIDVEGSDEPDTPVTPEEPEDPVTPEDKEYTSEIKTPSRTSIRNKDAIILHPDSSNVIPADSKYVWSWDNNNFKVTTNSDGTIKIVAENAGDTTFTLRLLDADGNLLATDSITMYSDSGFFQKLGGFFRSLFGATKTYAE